MRSKEETFKELYGINEVKVKCNWCMAEFEEGNIIIESVSEKELCPKCRRSGFLMDIKNMMIL